MLVRIADYRGGYGRLRFQELRSDPEAFLLTGIVAEESQTCLTDIMRRARGFGRAAKGRQLAMYLAHVLLSRSQDDVARLFQRDRTTVTHAMQAVEDRRDDPDFDRRIERIEARFERARRRTREVRHVA